MLQQIDDTMGNNSLCYKWQHRGLQTGLNRSECWRSQGPRAHWQVRGNVKKQTNRWINSEFPRHWNEVSEIFNIRKFNRRHMAMLVTAYALAVDW